MKHLILIILFAITVSAQTRPAPPTLITLPSITVGSVVTVTTGLQAALDKASPGDTLVIPAGATITAPAGGFVLRPKTSAVVAPVANPWITITTSAALPDGRVSPTTAGLARLVTADSGPVIATLGAAVYYRFVGLEFTVTPTSMADANAGGAANSGLLRLGDASGTNLANVASHLIVDRCFIHGDPHLNTLRGIALNSGWTAIVNSYLSDFHAIGSDSQAIAGWNGPGPYKITNNYLEAAGENVMFGGADPRIPNLIPSDIEISGNQITKPLTWKKNDPTYAGYFWGVKNLIEIKNAQRVLITGNTLSYSWASAQVGFALLLKSVNQDGTAPWSTCQDVEVVGNTVSHAGGALNIQGHDPSNASGTTSRLFIHDNQFTDIAAAWTDSTALVPGIALRPTSGSRALASTRGRF